MTNSPDIREGICERCDWIGIELDSEANRSGGPCITTPESPLSAWVLPTDEERMIATHTIRILRKQGLSHACAGLVPKVG